MISAQHIAETAKHTKLLGTPYSKLDCQALVEAVLKEAGMQIINYRGSNHMWRDLVYARFAGIKSSPPGSLAFIVRNDGGEKKRGYNDDMGNATHVAIVLDDDADGYVLESTAGGVQISKKARFTHYGLLKNVDYANDEGGKNNESERPTLDTIRKLVSILHDNLDSLEEFLNDIYRNS